MDNGNVVKPRQNRGTGKCWGCGREGVELVSSVPVEGAKRRICDACRKATVSQPGVDPVAVLALRRQPKARRVTKAKLYTLNTRLIGLIKALHSVGADDRVRDQIRALVEPLLSPIAEDIWPKGKPETARVPEVVPQLASTAEVSTTTTTPEGKLPRPKPKKERTAKDRARRAFNNMNSRRKKKGLRKLSRSEYESWRKKKLPQERTPPETPIPKRNRKHGDSGAGIPSPSLPGSGAGQDIGPSRNSEPT
jgi:hypothetical protein